jgi:uncharacterized glyoxalase superfamily protein PhnB
MGEDRWNEDHRVTGAEATGQPARVGRSTVAAEPDEASPGTQLERISAVTLATHDMARAIRFYSALGFEVCFGGEEAGFTSLRAGASHLNLISQPAGKQWGWWGRVIFHVGVVDATYQRALAHGLRPEAPPRDAAWGECFFHLSDPDGHELSFARPL